MNLEFHNFLRRITLFDNGFPGRLSKLKNLKYRIVKRKVFFVYVNMANVLLGHFIGSINLLFQQKSVLEMVNFTHTYVGACYNKEWWKATKNNKSNKKYFINHNIAPKIHDTCCKIRLEKEKKISRCFVNVFFLENIRYLHLQHIQK